MNESPEIPRHLPTPMQAIKARCLDCCGCAPKRQDEPEEQHKNALNEARNEVKACGAIDCPLWWYRFGAHPRTLQERKARRERGEIGEQPAHLAATRSKTKITHEIERV